MKKAEQRTKESILRELKEVSTLLALADKANDEARDTLQQYQKQFIEEFQSMLLGNYGIQYKSRISISDYYSDGKLSVDLYFYSDENCRSDFTVRLDHANNETKVSRFSASGKSISGDDVTAEEIEEYNNYYKMVFDVTNIFKYVEDLETTKSMNQLLASYKKPDVNYVNDYKLREQKKQLENELKVLELDLQVGRIVEYYHTGKNRYERTQWYEAIVEKVTPKSVVIKIDSLYRSFTIKKEDFNWRLRPVVREAA